MQFWSKGKHKSCFEQFFCNKSFSKNPCDSRPPCEHVILVKSRKERCVYERKVFTVFAITAITEISNQLNVCEFQR